MSAEVGGMSIADQVIENPSSASPGNSPRVFEERGKERPDQPDGLIVTLRCFMIGWSLCVL